MVVRKEVCLTQSEWYVMDCLWAYAPQTVMQLATDLSQRQAWPRAPPSPLWSRWRPRDWSAAHPWAGTRSITHVCGGRRQQSRRSAPSWTVSIGGVWG